MKLQLQMKKKRKARREKLLQEIFENNDQKFWKFKGEEKNLKIKLKIKMDLKIKTSCNFKKTLKEQKKVCSKFSADEKEKIEKGKSESI